MSENRNLEDENYLGREEFDGGKPAKKSTYGQENISPGEFPSDNPQNPDDSQINIYNKESIINKKSGPDTSKYEAEKPPVPTLEEYPTSYQICQLTLSLGKRKLSG